MARKIPKSVQAERTRAALLTAAHELFAEQGYADTSTEDIIQRAGTTRGALYYHFQDKADLFRSVFEQLRAARTQPFRSVYRRRRAICGSG